MHTCSEKEKQATDAIFSGENTGINFDAYEDIPVEASPASWHSPADSAASSCKAQQGPAPGLVQRMFGEAAAPPISSKCRTFVPRQHA